jgi:hypothetical protein
LFFISLATRRIEYTASPIGRKQVERAVRPVLVVVAPVDAENVFEVAAAEDQDARPDATEHARSPTMM